MSNLDGYLEDIFVTKNCPFILLSNTLIWYNEENKYQPVRQPNLLQWTQRWRITKRSNAIILNTTMGMLFYLVLEHLTYFSFTGK